jgi:DNA-binding beta-propeller fold protein YncE
MFRSAGTIVVLLCGILFAGSAIHPTSAQTYKTVGEYSVPGANASAHGIALDSDSRRLFVASDDGITVLNADTGAKLGSLQFKNTQDVLLIPVMNGEERTASTKAFATGDGRVISFSLADMKIAGTEQLPTRGASSLCYDEDAKTVEAVSAEGSLTTVDAESGKVVKSTRVVTGDGQIACGTLDHVYVADTSANVVHVLNHKTGRNDGDYPIVTGSRPSGLALDTKGRRLFVACENGVIEVIDTDSGFTFIELKGGNGAAHETFAWTPQGKGQWKAAAFVAQEDGTLTGVRMNAFINYTVGGQYKLTPGLGSIVFDEKTHHLFISALRSGAPVVVVAGY